MPEHHAATVRDAVDRALPAGSELHHEEVRAALVGEEVDRFLETHRHRAGPLVEQLVRTVDRGIEHPEPARPGREDRLEADGPVGVTEVACGGVHGRAPVDAPELRRRHAEPVEERVALSFVVRPVDCVGARDEDRHGEAVAVCGEPFQVERRLRKDDVDGLVFDDLEDGVGEARVRAGRDAVEGVAEVPADGAFRHVGADESDLAFAVLAQPAQEGGCAGRAGRGDEQRNRPKRHERSILSSASCPSRRSRWASSIARIVCPIVSPG